MSVRGSCVLAAIASAWMVGCAHAPGVAVRPAPPPEGPADRPSPEVVALWDDAVARFARLDAEERWDGAACHDALEAFERANRASGGRSARAIYMNGLVSMRCGNEEQARRLYERALELEASLCEARVAIGLLEMDAGREALARGAFSQAIARDGRCAPAYVNLAILQSEVPAEHDEAIANLRRALAARSDYLPALDRMALVYLAQSADRPEALRLAEVVCRQAQLLDPGYAPIYNTWGLIDVERNDLTGAIAKFERAMQLDPRFFEAHMNFGQIALGQRVYGDAARAFERARELRPSSYDAVLGLGVALRGLRQPEQAENMYRAALALDEARPEAWFDLGVLYHEHRDGSVEQLSQAEAFLREFLRRASPDGPFAGAVQDVVRWCAQAPRGRRARQSGCRPGRMQLILTARAFAHGESEPGRPAWLR